MNKDFIKVILVTAGAVLFNLVFWHEKLAVNTVLFDFFILGALFFLYPHARQHATVRWLLLGHLICLAMIVVHNTDLSKIAFVITGLLLAGFSEYIHRSAWFAGGSVLLNMLMVAASFTEPIRLQRGPAFKRRAVTRFIRFMVFPVALLMVFFII